MCPRFPARVWKTCGQIFSIFSQQPSGRGFPVILPPCPRVTPQPTIVPMKPTRRFPTIERLEDRIAPASFLVTNLLDDNSPGSLRKAVNDSNNGNGPDTIKFKAGLTGTIVLNGSLAFDEGITIKGPGSSKLTIDGGGVDRVFVFSNVQTDDPISVSGLTVTNGLAAEGAGIFSTEPLSLTDVKITGNHSPLNGSINGCGIWAHIDGNIVLKNSEISHNGSGVTFFGGGADLATTGGKIVISGTTVNGNHASRAGGLFVTLGGATTSLSIDHSTFTNNSGDADVGGALRVVSAGGAVVVKSATFTNNYSGNSVGNPGGGGISQDGGTLAVTSCIFTGNQSSHGGAIAFANGTKAVIASSKFSLNVASRNDGYLGGGAIYLENVAKWQVAADTFTANSTASAGGAIAAFGGDGEITKSTFRASAAKDGGAFYFSQNAGPASVLISNSRFTTNTATDNGGAIRLFSTSMTLKGSTFDHNFSGQDGGAVFANGNFDSDRSSFRDNFAGRDGGAIASVSFVFKLNGGVVANNHAAGKGGGLSFVGGGPTIQKVLITDNTSGGQGAGLYFTPSFPGVTSTGVVSQCKIIGNTVTSGASGGGVYLTADVTLTLTKNVITDNISGDGGGVFSAGAVTNTDNKIFDNFAPTHPDTFGL
jgi:predicted outer membrane repeat protein